LREEFAPLLEVRQADGVFLTSSGVEIVEVAEWDRTMVRRSPAVQELRSIFRPAGALKT
jgi:branched-subunit amino acid aminotransferase/4-amino-4-deoxychorismate lyase